jgi:hypothetical protein
MPPFPKQHTNGTLHGPLSPRDFIAKCAISHLSAIKSDVFSQSLYNKQSQLFQEPHDNLSLVWSPVTKKCNVQVHLISIALSALQRMVAALAVNLFTLGRCAHTQVSGKKYALHVWAMFQRNRL